MKKCIIFGAGFYGKGAYYKLNKYFDIIYYVDNNISIQGSAVYGIPIISLEQLGNVYDKSIEVIICSRSYWEMANQLKERGINEYSVMVEGFLYHYSKEETMMPRELSTIDYYKKDKSERSILFVQNTACIRTHKIASMMKKRGYKVFLFYTIAPPEGNNENFASVYDGIFTTFSATSFIDFVNNSDFDIVHSSNELDCLTNYLHNTNKKIVFDVHDMMSLCGFDQVETLVLEHLANTKSDGIIYTSQGALDIANTKFKLKYKKSFVLENLILNQIKVQKNHKKLSSIDNEIHCVYEGGIEGKNKNYHRYFEEIWKKITDCGIHIHYYCPLDSNYCKELEKKSPYLHFEGNLGSQQLATEMTKYDCGLVLLNVNDGNRTLLETASPNKVNEYLNSGLPVVVGDVQSLIRFVEKYKVGVHLDLDGDIKSQLVKVKKIVIPKDFLIKNKLTMDSYAEELDKFYTSVIQEDI